MDQIDDLRTPPFQEYQCPFLWFELLQWKFLKACHLRSTAMAVLTISHKRPAGTRSYAAMQIGTRCVDFRQFKSRNLWGFSRRVIIFVEFWCFWFNRKVAPVWKSFHCSPTGDIFQSYPPATASWNASAARTSAAALLRRPRHEVSLRLPPDPAQVRKSVGRWVCPRGGDPQNHLPMIIVFRER